MSNKFFQLNVVVVAEQGESAESVREAVEAALQSAEIVGSVAEVSRDYEQEMENESAAG